ncbi:hypothetical protein [Actinomyces ruminis]|uniref:Cysteinyl-tRNA synthetase n=1 Tax=Actinomyces ruminis TaxID=1937003 RepID=A0ABX4MDV7_9ACTO|nr:hypothetical protein [Actinomyces ruminis]PHP53328.1 hypothetical protein BW737_003400 [Actinomyces ruminis]
MVELEVDGASLSFPDGWEASKYDEWPFFRNTLSKVLDTAGKALHGCDIVALDGEHLWLIEAKDYAYQEAKVPKDLVAVVSEKVMDTLAGLHAGTRDEHTERETCRKAVRARKLYVALRIDLPGAQPHARRGRQAAAQQTMANYRQEFRKSLRRVVNGKVHVITGREDPPTVPWTARWSEQGRNAHRQT